MKHFIRGKLLASDTETTGFNTWKGAAPYAFSFCNDDGDTAYFEFPVDPFTREVQYQADKPALRAIRRIYADTSIEFVFFNAKFDIRQIRHNVGPFKGRLHEVMFAAHCCNSDERVFKLKHLANKYADYPKDDEVELQKATIRLRRRAKKLGWKIADNLADVPEDDGEGMGRRKKKSNIPADYWLAARADELLDDPAEVRRVVKLCEKYCVSDAERTMLLWLFYREKMTELDVWSTYKRELRLWPVTYRIEERGVRVSPKETRKLHHAYAAERDRNFQEILKYGEKCRKKGMLKPNVKQFNPASWQQLQVLLYEYLKLKPPKPKQTKASKKRKAAGGSTDQDALLELSAQHEVPNNILLWRAANKATQFLVSYHQKTVPSREFGGDMLIHADFNQVGPKTGRYSCREPNLQQTASKSTGRSANPIDVRSPFGPRRGHVWYTFDYSQLEVRIFADLSQESSMLKLIHSGGHIHKGCANHVWGGYTDAAIKNAIHALGLDQKSEASDSEAFFLSQKAIKKYRGKTDEKTALNFLEAFDGDIVAAEESIKKANTVNKSKLAIFTRIFGGGIPSIMNLMKCSREEAQQFLNEYGEAFPEMDPWMKSIGRQARKDRCVRTAYERRIAVDPQFAYRAVNYKVQGSAADLMKRALVNCDLYLRRNDVQGWIVMTIHDEIVFEFRRGIPIMEHVFNIKAIMEDHGGAFGIPMPTKVERVTRRWVDKEKVEWATAA